MALPQVDHPDHGVLLAEAHDVRAGEGDVGGSAQRVVAGADARVADLGEGRGVVEAGEDVVCLGGAVWEGVCR